MTWSRKEFQKIEDTDFKIGAVVSDGMWYSFTKWKDIAAVTADELSRWIDDHMADGTLVQSPTGARSYRFPLRSVLKWYEDHGLQVGEQLVDFLFPPRIWDGMTETEGFLSAPLREIGIVSFSASPELVAEVRQELRGVAMVREAEPGRFKAFALNAAYVRAIVENVLKGRQPPGTKKLYSLAVARRREIVDFTADFAEGLIRFYRDFGRSLAKREMETIRIFLPEEEDQESQMLMWVLQAVSKFDETAAVPFSGYFDTVLHRWPYDLPQAHLGKELSTFQRNRSKAVKALRKRLERSSFTAEEIASEMGVDRTQFNDLEEKHRVWARTQASTTLSWEDSSDEKLAESNLSGGIGTGRASTDPRAASRLSAAVVDAALETGCFDDALGVISQIDASDLDLSRVEDMSAEFVAELGHSLGVGG